MSQWWGQEPQSRQGQEPQSWPQRQLWQEWQWWCGHWWYKTEKGLWEKERSGRRWDDITEDSYWEATMQTWERGTWNDRAARSVTEVFAEAEHGRIAWMPTASAAGNARGDEDAVAFTESPDPDEDTGESSSEVGFQGPDSVISEAFLDPDDADAYELNETTRECDAAVAEIAESFFAAAKARDDGMTSEEGSSGFSSWERFPQKTQAAGKIQHTKSAQTIWEAAVAANHQNEPEDGTDLPTHEPWQQKQAEPQPQNIPPF